MRAYSDALNLVLETTQTIPFVKEERFSFQVAYSSLRLVEYELEKLGIEKVQKEFSNNVYFVVEARKELLLALHSFLDGISHIPYRKEDTKRE